MNAKLIAEALRALANAFETPDGTPEAPPAQPAAAAPTAAPVPRGRGRPPKAPVEAPAAPVPSPSAVDDAKHYGAEDLFSTEAPAAPTATLDEVRTALTGLKAATDQATALGVLKSAGGADNLSSLDKAKYGAVVAAAKAALPAPKAAEPEDPFETPAAPAPAPVVVEAAPSLEDVKAACVAAGKRTAQDKVQAIVMAHGGSAPSSTGAPGPSLKALPVPSYAAVIAAVKALPTTK